MDLLSIMLGTNDTKDRLGQNAACIALGMERLIQKAQSIPCWTDGKPNILVVCPPHIGEGLNDPCMGTTCVQKSRELAGYMEPVAKRNGCAWLDAEGVGEFNKVDFMHLTRKGHADLAAKLAEIVPTLV